jgi:hypothetical protein
MRLKEIEYKYKSNVFDELSDAILMRETDEWVYHSSVPLNGIIAIGWLSNDDILVINVDGIFIFDIHKKDIIFRDYESSFKKNISDDNTTFFVENKSESVSIFGLRGGGGNLLTKDNLWKLKRIDIAWNIKVPCILNLRTNKSWFLELRQNSYEGEIYLGFSKSENYFVVMGDGGIDIFACVGRST